MEIYQINKQTHNFNKISVHDLKENIGTQSVKGPSMSISARPMHFKPELSSYTVYSDVYTITFYRRSIKDIDNQIEAIVLNDNPIFKKWKVINPVENVMKFIENSQLASFKHSQRDKIKSFFSEMHDNNDYNIFKLVDLLNSIYKVLSEHFGQKKNVKIEFDYYTDNEEPDLNGLSLTVFLSTDDAKMLSDIWEYLNEKLGVEDSLSDKIFFNVKQRFPDAT